MTDQAQNRGLGVPTLMWLGMILAVTLERSFPALSARYTTAALFIGLACAAWCVAITRGARARRRASADRRLMLVMLGLPIIAAALAVWHGEASSALAPIAGALTLAAAARLDRETRAASLWRALALLVGGSVLLGLVYAPAVEPNERALLRSLYDGRLVGLLQTPNVLGQCAMLLILLTLITKRGGVLRLTVAMALFAIAASGSQTALLASVAVLLVWATWRVAGTAGLVFAGWAATLGLTLTLMWLTMRPDHPVTNVSSLWSDVTFSSRTHIWSLVLAQDIPFLGIGQRGIDAIFGAHVIPGATGVGSAHNVALDAYLRDGVPGVAALGVAVGAMVMYAFRSRSGLALAALAAFVLEGFVEVTPTHAPFYAMYFVVLTAARLGDRVVDGDVTDRGALSVERLDLLDHGAESRRRDSVTNRGVYRDA